MRTRAPAVLLTTCAAAVLAGLVGAGSFSHRGNPLRATVAVEPGRLHANGYDTATLSVGGDCREQPTITITGNSHGAAVEDVVREKSHWTAGIRAGVTPGKIGVRVECAGAAAATAEIELLLDARDSAADGTPDFLRLEDSHDRQSFRRWFTYLAEMQYFTPPERRPPEIVDCAALIRYAYREALRNHDTAWADAAGLAVVPAFDSVGKYQYPYTPLGAGLFRVKAGPFGPADLSSGGFLQFADAQTLWRFNSYPLTRNLSRALPGDLLFFRQRTGHTSFHSMIYLGESQIHRDGNRYVLYHTGPEGDDPGQIRRLTVEQLMRFPQTEWRPFASNPSFLGVSRWNILRKATDEPDAE